MLNQAKAITQFQEINFNKLPGRKHIAAFLLVTIIFFISIPVKGQVGGAFPKEVEPVSKTLDELLNAWYIGKLTVDSNSIKLNRYNFKSYEIPLYSDKVYRKRLDRLQSPIPLGFNPVVKRFIELYVKDKRDQVENMLGLGHYYFPMIEEKLDKAGLPLELKYVPVIESALNTHAVSKSGATGLWQFIYSTAKMYDLEITSYIDERRDPYVLTDKAILFLQDLYSIYKDWLFVIAAYNCGPGSVNKAIQRSGYKSNFWDVYPYLPNETRGYVPAFIAANYAMTYHVEHNLYAKNIYTPGFLDTVHVYRRLDFSVVSKALQITESHLLELNPQYKQKIIPQSLTGKKYVLRLPIAHASKFAAHRERIYKYQDLLDKRDQSKHETASNVTSINPYSAEANGKKLLVYNVKREDTKALIAQWFDCSIADIDRWNNFPNGQVKYGKTVNIYVPISNYSTYEKMNYMSFAEKQNKKGGSNIHTPSTGVIAYYTVKPGDTLWAIAKKFPKSSVDELRKLNGLGNEGLKPGQRIRVRK